MQNAKPNVTRSAAWWTGNILKGIVVLFLLFDSAMKLIGEQHVLKSCSELGLPLGSVRFLGAYLLVATVCYALPVTSVMGATLLTAYLGGAAAVTFVAGAEGHPYFFPAVFCLIVWIAEFLRTQKLRSILPLIK